MKNVDKYLLGKMIIWRIVLAKMASYTEVETQWDFDTIMEANEVLDIKEDISEALIPKTKQPGE